MTFIWLGSSYVAAPDGSRTPVSSSHLLSYTQRGYRRDVNPVLISAQFSFPRDCQELMMAFL